MITMFSVSGLVCYHANVLLFKNKHKNETAGNNIITFGIWTRNKQQNCDLMMVLNEIEEITKVKVNSA